MRIKDIKENKNVSKRNAGHEVEARIISDIFICLSFFCAGKKEMICFEYPVFCFFNIKAVRELIEGIVRESEHISTFVSKGLFNLLTG